MGYLSLTYAIVIRYLNLIHVFENLKGGFMDTRTGRIYTTEDLIRLYGSLEKIPLYIRPMQVGPTPRQVTRKPPRVGRNDPCPCGSGKKFKHCCFGGA
jgi:hypothetical protein